MKLAFFIRKLMVTKGQKNVERTARQKESLTVFLLVAVAIVSLRNQWISTATPLHTSDRGGHSAVPHNFGTNSDKIKMCCLAVRPTRGSLTGIIRGHCYQWRASMWCRHSTSRDANHGQLRGGCFPSFLQPTAADYPPPRGTHYRQRVSQPLCFFLSILPLSLSRGKSYELGCTTPSTLKGKLSHGI